ncbi:hypothetical protein [Gymnodinialimonas sp.]
MTQTLFRYPKDGKVPDLSDVLSAETLEDLFDRGAAGQEAAFAYFEEERAQALGLAPGEDPRRGIRDPWWIILSDLWGDLWYLWRTRSTPRPPQTLDTVVGFQLPLAVTAPCDSPDAVAGFVAAVIRQITASRGEGPKRFSIPEGLVERIDADMRATEANSVVYEAEAIVAYWPPKTAPALALSVYQDAPGSQVNITLMAHGTSGHRRFTGLLAEQGVSLE